MNTSPRPFAPAFRRLLLALSFALAVGPLTSAVESLKKDYDLAADDAPRALKQFAAQSGEQLLFSPTEVAGVRTLAVKGVHSAREALEKMLEGTSLVVAQDKSTGALAVRKETAAEAKNVASRPAEAKAANDPASCDVSGGCPHVAGLRGWVRPRTNPQPQDMRTCIRMPARPRSVER